ncbi:MAG: VapC toxin family PIN domain ribonuclease [Armatimonadetes bacterium CG_4_10_14_3_um_filter_66_18]|nr:type II toxin-antitoxin system VapC family toxin [Armatimonadota bacterium]OIP03456.1 MAG: hypothetical protein AUJ96_14585 [Armatimonadetes bacterium CG2_30_66_41]PIU93022.1 MAG: VapC toxin family PIN domain ribonuclease [Armatimonadetes bacterium CG06_land_8_20_14_3_00_66_21]PIY50405.1 MAG: VapC toxin family PIN domain ribonuclease [Armatimonadetes bacterium CG_4_10_14_3_um_filter_66_18]PIZ48156.1 MAG: VapC toxin family PIN domain ribonuclease [Armatimonadetes bacterium CG_4_10_14_0_8_um_f
MAASGDPPLFVDTAGWGCYYDVRHPRHEDAKLLYRLAVADNRRIVTTNYVVAETVALFTSPLRVRRPAVIEFVRRLKASSQIEIVHIDPQQDAQAWELLQKRPDKEWSLVDCASFVVMEARGISEALTTDHNFEQAGFVRLLTP